jgi:putative ABC transport system permease protein
MGGGGSSNGLVPEGWDTNRRIDGVLRLVTPGFFETMRVPILKGRQFDDNDRAASQRVMIVSEALARRAFPGQDPIGKRIDCCEPGPNGSPVWKTIVGVAGDIRSRGPAAEPQPEFYLPFTQAPPDSWHWFRTYYIIARAQGDPEPLAPAMRRIMERIDPDMPLFDVRTMTQRLSASIATARFNTLLLSALGVMGLILAARVIASQLFAVSRTDPLTISLVAATLMLVALAASAVPARRAASIDPTRALQSE